MDSEQREGQQNDENVEHPVADTSGTKVKRNSLGCLGVVSVLWVIFRFIGFAARGSYHPPVPTPHDYTNLDGSTNFNADTPRINSSTLFDEHEMETRIAEQQSKMTKSARLSTPTEYRTFDGSTNFNADTPRINATTLIDEHEMETRIAGHQAVMTRIAETKRANSSPLIDEHEMETRIAGQQAVMTRMAHSRVTDKEAPTGTPTSTP